MLYEQHSFSNFSRLHFSHRRGKSKFQDHAKLFLKNTSAKQSASKSLEIRTCNVKDDTFLTNANSFAQLSVCMAANFKCCGKTNERKIVTEPQGFCT